MRIEQHLSEEVKQGAEGSKLMLLPTQNSVSAFSKTQAGALRRESGRSRGKRRRRTEHARTEAKGGTLRLWVRKWGGGALLQWLWDVARWRREQGRELQAAQCWGSLRW